MITAIANVTGYDCEGVFCNASPCGDEYPDVYATGATNDCLHCTIGSLIDERPECRVHGMDRRNLPGPDTVHVMIKPFGAEYEYGPLCQTISLTDIPPMATINTTVATWHSLGEFQILPRTQLPLLGILRLMEGGAAQDTLNLIPAIDGMMLSGLCLYDVCHNGLKQNVQLFPALRTMEMRAEITCICTPVWKIGIDIEAWMRKQWSVNTLVVGSIGRWVDDLPVYASALYAAVPVSGVQRWTEGIWANAGLSRPWLYAEADAIRINQIIVEVVPKGGVTYLNLHQVPRWVKEALVQGAAPYQILMPTARIKPRHTSDINIEVTVEVNA